MHLRGLTGISKVLAKAVTSGSKSGYESLKKRLQVVEKAVGAQYHALTQWLDR